MSIQYDCTFQRHISVFSIRMKDFNLLTKLIFAEKNLKYFCMLMKHKFGENLLNNNLFYMKEEKIRRCSECKMEFNDPNYSITHGYYNNFDHWGTLKYEENDNICNGVSEEITILKPIKENVTGFYLLSEKNKVLKIYYNPYDEIYFQENIQIQFFEDFDKITNEPFFTIDEMNIIIKIVENIEYINLPSNGYYWNSPTKPIQ